MLEQKLSDSDGRHCPVGFILIARQWRSSVVCDLGANVGAFWRGLDMRAEDESEPHRDAFLSEELFGFGDGVLAEVKDAGGQHGIGLSFEEHFGEVF